MTKFDKKILPSRHVTEGPARAPHRSYYYAMGLTDERTVQRVERLMEILHTKPDDRKVVGPARQAAEEALRRREEAAAKAAAFLAAEKAQAGIEEDTEDEKERIRKLEQVFDHEFTEASDNTE